MNDPQEHKKAEEAFEQISKKFGISLVTDPKTGKTGYNIEAFAVAAAKNAPGQRNAADLQVGAFLFKRDLLNPTNKDNDSVITKEEFVAAWLQPPVAPKLDTKTIKAENEFYDLAAKTGVPLTKDVKTGETGYDVQALSNAFDKKLEGETKKWFFPMSEAEVKEKATAFKKYLDSVNTNHDGVISREESVSATLTPPQTPASPKVNTTSRPK